MEEKSARYDLSVVIVSWNCWDMLRVCLQHLFASRTTCAFKVILVDNDSADGTLERVEAEFSDVEVIRSGGNLGFAKGNNLGFTRLEGRYALLLNPDAFMTDVGLLEYIVHWLDEHTEYGALGCRIIFPDGSHQVGDAGYRPNTSAMACWALGLNRLSPRLRGMFIANPPGGNVVVDVDWICGAFMLIRRPVIESVGGFDESFFMYAEDVEWGCRARQRGIRIAYLPWREIVHVQSGTQYRDGRASFSTKWLDNLMILHRRLDPHACWRCVAALIALGFLSRACLYRMVALLRGPAALLNKSRAMMAFAAHAWSIRN